jgi:hypothetical protein
MIAIATDATLCECYPGELFFRGDNERTSVPEPGVHSSLQ